MNKIVSVFVMSLLFLGCQQSGDANKEAAIDSSFFSENIAKSSIANGSQLGVYMVLHNEVLSDASVVDDVKNIPFDFLTDEERTLLVPANNGKIYYPLNGAHVDLYAYLPYREGLVDAEFPIDVTEQSATDKFDVVRAKVSDRWNENVEANFVFDHCLAKLSLSITNGYNVELEELKGMSVTIMNLPVSAKLNIGTMAMSDVGENNEVMMVVNDEGMAAHAVLLPINLEEVKVAFELKDGAVYYWQPKLLPLEQGIEAHYDIVVKEKDVEALSNDIKGWRYGDEGEIVAN